MAPSNDKMASCNKPTASPGANKSPSGASGSAGETPPDGSENKPKRVKTETEKTRYLCVHCLEDGHIDILLGYNGLRKHQGRVHNCWMTTEDRLLCPKCGQGFDRRDKKFPNVRTVPEEHRDLPDCTDPKHMTRWRPQPAHDAIEHHRRADIWAPDGGALTNPALILGEKEVIYPENKGEVEKRWDAVSQRYNMLRGHRSLPGPPFAAPVLGNAVPAAFPGQPRAILPAQNGAGAGAYSTPAPHDATAMTHGSSYGPPQPQYPQPIMGHAQHQQPAAASMGQRPIGMSHGNNVFGHQQHGHFNGTNAQHPQPATYAGGNRGFVFRQTQQYLEAFTMPTGVHHQMQCHGAHASPGLDSDGDVVGQVGRQLQHLQPMRDVATNVPPNFAAPTNSGFGVDGLGMQDAQMSGAAPDSAAFSQEANLFFPANNDAGVRQPLQGSTALGGVEMQQNAAMVNPDQQWGLAAPPQPYDQPETWDQTGMGAADSSLGCNGQDDAGMSNFPSPMYGGNGEMLQGAGMGFGGQAARHPTLPRYLEEPGSSRFSLSGGPPPSYHQAAAAGPPAFDSLPIRGTGMRQAGHGAPSGALQPLNQGNAGLQPLVGPSGTSAAGTRRTYDDAFAGHGGNGRGHAPFAGATAIQRSHPHPTSRTPRRPRGRGAIGTNRARAIEPQALETMHEGHQEEEPVEALDQWSPWTTTPPFQGFSADDSTGPLFAGVDWSPLEAPATGDAAAAPTAPAMGSTQDPSPTETGFADDLFDFQAASAPAVSLNDDLLEDVLYGPTAGMADVVAGDTAPALQAPVTGFEQDPAVAEPPEQDWFVFDGGMFDAAPEMEQQADDSSPDVPVYSPLWDVDIVDYDFDIQEYYWDEEDLRIR